MVLDPGIAVLATKISEAATAMCHEDIRTRLRDALNEAYPKQANGPYFYCYIVAVFGDDKSGDVVYSCNDDLKKAGYTMTPGGAKIDQTTAVDVVPLTTYELEGQLTEAGARNSKRDLMQLQTIHDSAAAMGANCSMQEGHREAKAEATFVESALATEVLRVSESAGELNPLVKIISAGRGSTGYYTEALLKRDGPKIFKRGTLMYINHATNAEEAARPEGDWSKLAAVTTGDAYWEANGKDGPALYAPAKVFANVAAEVREKAPYTGVSIRAAGLYAEAATGEPKPGLKASESKLAPDGKPGLIGQLTRADSIDLVTKAGRDGKLLLESAVENPNEGAEVDMTEAEIKEFKALRESMATLQADNRKFKERAAVADAAIVVGEYFGTVQIPDGIKERVTKRVLAGSIPLTEAGDLDKAKLTAFVEAETKDEAAYVEKLTGHKVVTNMGSAAPAQLTEAQRTEQAAADTSESQSFAEVMGFGGKTHGAKIFIEGRNGFDRNYNSGQRDGITTGAEAA